MGDPYPVEPHATGATPILLESSISHKAIATYIAHNTRYTLGRGDTFRSEYALERSVTNEEPRRISLTPPPPDSKKTPPALLYKFGRERQPGREGLRISVVAPQEED